MSYVDEVTSLLSFEFSLDGAARDVLRETVEFSASQNPDHIEFILDNPSSANWRLKVNYPWMERGLRVSCYKTFPSQEDQAREDRINASLSYLASRMLHAASKKPRALKLVWVLVGLQVILLAALGIIYYGWVF